MDWKYECVPINLKTGELIINEDTKELKLNITEIKTYLETVNTNCVLNDEAPHIGMVVLPVIIKKEVIR